MSAPEDDAVPQDTNALLIVFGFIAAAGFGSNVPLLGLIGLLACAGYIAATADPAGAPARLLAAGQQQAGRLVDSTRAQVPAALPTQPAAPNDQALVAQLLQQPVAASAALAPTPAATGTAQPTLPVLSWKQWRVRVIHAHHLFVVGNTSSGKTTLVRALLPAKKGMLLVLDPKNRPGKWGDAHAIGLDDDAEFTWIEHAMQCVLVTLRERQRALNRGTIDFTPLTVVVDEAPEVAEDCPTFPKVFKRVGSIGRELEISLIVLSQRSTVKSLGIEGDGQSRENFMQVYLGKFARRIEPALTGQQYAAVLDDEGDRFSLDVSPLPAYARLPIQASPLPLDLPGSDASAFNASPAAPVVPALDDDEARMLAMMRNGASINAIKAAIGGNKVAARNRIHQIAVQYGMPDYMRRQ